MKKQMRTATRGVLAFTRAARLSLAFMGLLAFAGCEIPGVLISKATGPSSIKARYHPSKEPMLVLVESYHNGGDITQDANGVLLGLTKIIKDNEVAPTVDSQAVEKLHDSNPEGYRRMTVDAIGRAVGARQVLYVNISDAEVERPKGSQAVRGVMNAVVRIVDSATGETRWPTDYTDGQLVHIQTPWIPTNTEDVETRAHDQMTMRMADLIGKLFHDFGPDELTPAESTMPK